MSKPETTDIVLSRALRLSRRAQLWLFWERYAPVFALAALFVALFFIGSFGGIWDRIGDPWRLIALGGALYVLVKAALSARNTPIPKLSDGARRVEQDNQTPHRPIDVLSDNAAISPALWDKHVKSARRAAMDLTPARPQKVLAGRDKYYLRYAAPAAVVLAMMVGAGDNFERVKRSLTPSWQAGMNGADAVFDAWVDPPDYTARPPVYFKNKRQVDIPAGSEFVARISGLKNAPRLKITEGSRTRYLSLTRLSEESFEARTTLTKSATAQWRIGTRQQNWALTVTPDTPPIVTIDSDPKADKRDRLAFTYSLADDFGVAALSLEMRLLDEPDVAPSSVTVPLPSRAVRRADKAETALDMTRHIWTGRKVVGQLVATDALGQSARSRDVYFTVPDKIFIEPLAKAIVEQRNLILASIDEPYGPLPRKTRREWENSPIFDERQPEFKLDRAPAKVQRAALLIDAVTENPAGLFQDPALYMGLRNVLARLRFARDSEGLAGIPGDMWEMAIRAEFGLLGTALENMRRAEAALNDGIARRAPEREIDVLFERYNESVDAYMDELRRKAILEGNVAEAGEQGGQGGGTNADEIKELLKAIEEANAQGDTEGARKALKRLAELLENMQMQLAQGGQGEGGDPSQGDMTEEEKEALEKLADLLGEQRELKDETEQSQRAEQGEPQDGDSGQNAQSGQGSQSQEGQSQGDQAGQSSGAPTSAEPKTAQELAEQQSQLEALLGQLEEGLPAGGANAGDNQAMAGGQTGDTDEPGAGEEPGDAGSAGGEPGDEQSAQGGGQGGDTDPNADARGGGSSDQAERSPGEAVDDAQTAMQAARDALERGDLSAAAQAQEDAIAALREAAQNLVAQAQARRGEGGQQQADGDGNPLGQNDGNGVDDGLSELDIDTRDNVTRSRELMEELRRRASEAEREEEELNYLERLLERF